MTSSPATVPLLSLFQPHCPPCLWITPIWCLCTGCSLCPGHSPLTYPRGSSATSFKSLLKCQIFNEAHHDFPTESGKHLPPKCTHTSTPFYSVLSFIWAYPSLLIDHLNHLPVTVFCCCLSFLSTAPQGKGFFYCVLLTNGSQAPRIPPDTWTALSKYLLNECTSEF